MSLKLQPNALQDTLFEHLRKHGVPVTIYLVNGVRLQGTVAEVDSYSLLLTKGSASQLVYKSAISSIMPDQVDQGVDQQRSLELPESFTDRRRSFREP